MIADAYGPIDWTENGIMALLEGSRRNQAQVAVELVQQNTRPLFEAFFAKQSPEHEAESHQRIVKLLANSRRSHKAAETKRLNRIRAQAVIAASEKALSDARLMRRAAYAAGERFTLLEIFERDAGVCHLCRMPVEWAPVLHKRGPSMDHLVPIVQHGPHTRANVMLAHRDCNSVRYVDEVGAARRRIRRLRRSEAA